MEAGGTETFPDLGKHCNHPDCRQLDFLPFRCGACSKFFCLEHRSYTSHDCPKSEQSSRKVVVCEICSAAIETTGHHSAVETSILEKHQKSENCDPTKNQKLKCPVRRCKELLTFSNTAYCKHCQVKVCLKHRFPADHTCKPDLSLATAKDGTNKFLRALALRNGKDCGNKNPGSVSQPSVKAY